MDYIKASRLVDIVERYCCEPFDANDMKMSTQCKCNFHINEFSSSISLTLHWFRVSHIIHQHIKSYPFWCWPIDSIKKSRNSVHSSCTHRKWPTYLVGFTACHSLNLTLLPNTVCVCVCDQSVEIVVENFDKINYSTFWPIKFQKLNWMLRIFVTHKFNVSP